jgi:hypothetical protein
VLCCASSHCRIDGASSGTSAPASASAPIESVVTHVARLVSIGQLPSSRIDPTRNRTPASTTGLVACPIPAMLMVTKLVSGVASR